MEGKNPGKNQPYILDVSVETIELKKRKSSTVHENSQPKVAKIPVMIKFVKNKATDISKTNRESSLIEESNQTEQVSNVTETSNVKFIYSEKATNFCEISTVDLSYVVMVKSTVEIS